MEEEGKEELLAGIANKAVELGDLEIQPGDPRGHQPIRAGRGAGRCRCHNAAASAVTSCSEPLRKVSLMTPGNSP